VVGVEIAEFAPAEVREIFTPTDYSVLRATHTGALGFDLIADIDGANNLWNALGAAGARPVGHDALEILRIEAGIPRYGIDMDDTNVVTEAALDDAVSYTKGCYVGQEIIARIKYRGHVAKKLSGIRFDGAVRVEPGAAIKSGDKEIGRVTSTTYSPHLGHTIALGYVKYDYLAAETAVSVAVEGSEAEARITALPFVNRAVQ